MSQQPISAQQAEAIDVLQRNSPQSDAAAVVAALSTGLTQLRVSVYTRIHRDVELEFGVDSMIDPVSVMKTEARVFNEIDAYQTAQSAALVHEKEYLGENDAWYVGWLTRLVFGTQADAAETTERIAAYAVQAADQRRLTFSSELERTLREAARAPLIIYRLLPWAVAIVTAMSFSDHATAAEARRNQQTLLPCITQCNVCRGEILPIGQKCDQCHNPFWNYQWLTS